MNLEKNVERKDGYNQVCVWRACVVKNSKEPKTEEDFEKFMKENFDVDVQYLEEITTGPDVVNKKIDEETGGRTDLFFALHNKDIGKFVIPRLQFGISWVEDVLSKYNYNSPIYPSRVFKYCCWNKDSISSVKTYERALR